jgi:hypothetical protein
MVNIALLSDAYTIEVPHFLLACNVKDYDPYAEKTGKECVWGYIDKQGKWVVKPQYLQAFDFDRGFGKVNVGKYLREGEYAFVNTKGAFVAENDLPKSILIHAGRGAIAANRQLTPFVKGGLVGFTDMSEKVVIPPKFAGVGKFSDGLAAVILDDNIKCLDKEDPKHLGFSSDKDRFVGYIDVTGKLVIPARFRIDNYSLPLIHDEKSSFKNGLAVVRDADGKFGAIDKT